MNRETLREPIFEFLGIFLLFGGAGFISACGNGGDPYPGISPDSRPIQIKKVEERIDFGNVAVTTDPELKNIVYVDNDPSFGWGKDEYAFAQALKKVEEACPGEETVLPGGANPIGGGLTVVLAPGTNSICIEKIVIE